MEQKIPHITSDDIKRILKRDFANFQFDDIIAILKTYQSDSGSDSGKNRVYGSILRLSDGDIELLKSYVKEACYDYRDVISKAEYPNYSKVAFEDDLSEEEEERSISEDWIQYRSWLNKI